MLSPLIEVGALGVYVARDTVQMCLLPRLCWTMAKWTVKIVLKTTGRGGGGKRSGSGGGGKRKEKKNRPINHSIQTKDLRAWRSPHHVISAE
jgi:hypothetical protein